jgi:dUTP pyrophosphatase
MSNSIGVIDSGYRGPIIAAVDNMGQTPYHIRQGQRLFQICEPRLEPMEIVIVNNLDTTLRGAGGFGSTDN